MGDYLGMGGYAGFVWPSYIITALVMGVLFAASWQGLKSRQRTLEALRAALGRRGDKKTTGTDTTLETAGDS